MLKFERETLTNRLERVEGCGRVAFALLCAERLMPLYEASCGWMGIDRQGSLRSAADHLWSLIEAGQLGRREPLLSDSEGFMPDEDGEWSAFNPLVENAVIAIVSACECELSGDVLYAVRSAAQGYEAVDFISHTVGKIEFSAPDAESLILASRYVQDELRSQLRDLEELGDLVPSLPLWQSGLVSLRGRAQWDGGNRLEVMDLLRSVT